LKAFFGDLASDIEHIKLPKYQDTGRCLGYAHCLFKTEACYLDALKLAGNKIGSRYLDIKKAEGQKILNSKQTSESAQQMPSDCKTLFVKGLPYDFKEDDVGDRFRKFGEIKAIRLAYNW